MPDVVDLSTLRKQQPEAAAYEDLSPEEQAEVDALAEGADIPAQSVRTAFLVIVDNNGAALATPDLDLAVDRRYQPSPADVIGACAIIQSNMTAQQAGAHAAMGVQQVAAQQMEAMQNATIAAQLGLGRN